ncbi:MAG: HAD hydrolase family protein [Planctomycetes bacterium]|nr:HAD hydrolase family protein [Planctomycetota bacterium]
MAKRARDSSTAHILARLSAIELVAFDVDGVLTDGGIAYAGRTEIQRYHVHDGYGLVALRKAGLTLAWITGRGSLATRTRARELGVKELHVHVKDKRATLERLQRKLGIPRERTASMGDDEPDLGLRDASAFFAAPADARERIRALADLVTSARGGAGAVREFADLLLAARAR